MRYLTLLLLAGCAAPDVVAPVGHPVSLNIVTLPPSVTGQQAFAQECSTCHGDADGFDLAYFSYPDTNIVRRALGHVDAATAGRIASYIGSLSVPHVPENTRLFQPAGAVLANDAAFAVGVFGSDQWPAALTRTQLLAIDPLTVRIPLDLLPWSNEGTKTLEWLAKVPLDPATLTYDNNRVASALDTYEASPSPNTLGLAMQAIWEVTKTPANKAAPCPYLYRKTPPDFPACFAALSYASALGAEYMIRRGLTGFVDPRVHQIWWNTGFVAMQSGQQSAVPGTGDPTNQQNRWFYLGWMFDPAHVEAIYTTTSLRTRSMPRLATFVALRSLVARPAGSWTEDVNVFADFLEVAASTPAAWAVNATTFALTELRRRLQAGEHPPAAFLATARADVNSGMLKVKAKVTAAQFAPLQVLANQVLAGL